MKCCKGDGGVVVLRYWPVVTPSRRYRRFSRDGIPPPRAVLPGGWVHPATVIFKIQDEILQKIGSSLSGAWSGVIAKHGLASTAIKPTDNLDAYELYLLATEHKHNFTMGDFLIAEEYLIKAVEIDPQYGKAWINLAIIYVMQTDHVIGAEDKHALIEKQKNAVRTAHKLPPRRSRCFDTKQLASGHERQRRGS